MVVTIIGLRAAWRGTPVSPGWVRGLGLLGVFLAWGCGQAPVVEPPPAAMAVSDLREIQDRGHLIAVTGYDALGYFLYRGEPRGFQFELLEELEAELGLPVEVRVERDLNRMFQALEEGEADLIAYHLTVTGKRQDQVAFTRYLVTTPQVLVQRKPQGWRQRKRHQNEDEMLRNQVELAGRTVYVQRGSAFVQRLRHLSEEIGAPIDIVEAEAGVTVDDLIRSVHEGEIVFTVADEIVGRTAASHYQNLDVETAVSFPQRIAWAVHPRASQLREAIDSWLLRIKKEPTFNLIYTKYYRNPRAFRTRLASDYFVLGEGRISPYDELMKAEAEQLGWDWRLLASLVHQESRFDPEAESWAGALGLMQLLPATAEQYGAADPMDPEASLRAGVRYLRWLDDSWRAIVGDSEERLKFVLAAYNAGKGHVDDARRLATIQGRDPTLWDNHVATCLLLKSDPRFFNHPSVRHGYCRGRETVRYVEQVLRRFHHYRNLHLDEDEPEAEEASPERRETVEVAAETADAVTG